MKKQIEEEIQKRKEIYKKSPVDMVSAYNREKETIKDYNGRQLLELLQNADDEKSSEVYIELNTNKSYLVVANKGIDCKPFTFKGIRSLMISNLSPKQRKKYIGNKGLGFRSIIDWSEMIEINSNNLNIVFSRDIILNVYKELFTEEEHIQFVEDELTDLDIKPIPFLGIPKVRDSKQNRWTTKVTIKYKDDFYDEIKEQIDNLKDEVLLFLNHLTKITLNIDGITKEITKECIAKEENTETVILNNEKWVIYKDENILPDALWEKATEEENYQLKIALKENNDIENNLLYSYFPTRLRMDFPFIIHGTFDLDTSRNDLPDSKKNKYLIEQLVHFIVNIAKLLTKDEVSYKALEFLKYQYPNQTLEILGFYKYLDEVKDTLKIFPCVDGKYRKKSDVLLIGNEFSDFIETNNFSNIFSNLLISTKSTSINIENFVKLSSITNWSILMDINKLSLKINRIDIRVDFIYIIFNLLPQYESIKKLPFLLLDENEEFPKNGEEIFSLPNGKKDLIVPHYMSIKFVNEELFNKLLKKFDISEKEELVSILSKMTNIEEYDAYSIIKRIITETDNIQFRYSKKIIKEMVKSLYSNYQKMGSKPKLSKTVHLIAKDKTIQEAKDLYLSKTYPSGELTEELFKDIFEKDMFLIKIDYFELENQNIDKIEEFFLWLGVNKYTKIVPIHSYTSYNELLFTIEPKPDSFGKLKGVPSKKIDYIHNILTSLSPEKLITWILKDKFIINELNKTYKISHIKLRGSIEYPFIDDAPSYVSFQISKPKPFKDYFLSTGQLAKLCSNISINFNHSLFKKYKIKKDDIKKLMIQLGAIEDFDKLSNEQIKNIVMNLPINAPDGKGSKLIYKHTFQRMIGHFHGDNKGYFFLDKGIPLFATKNQKSAYYPSSEVYYGNKKFPRKILETKAIFDFPKGEKYDYLVPHFFHLQNLDEIEITIINKEINTIKTEEFYDFLQTIFPYILVYLIKDILEEENRIIKLKKLQKLSIKLCNNVEYKAEEKIYTLDNNDYIEDKDNNFYIAIDESLSLQELREDYNFCDTFSSILGILFYNNKENFINIIKDSIKFTENAIIDKIGKEELYRAKELMGIANEKESFWKTIYKLLHKEYKYKPDNLLESITNDLNLKTDITAIDYQDFKSLKSCKIIKELFTEIDLTIEQYNNQEPYYKLDFFKYHNHNLSNTFHHNQKNFEQHLYQYCIKYSKEREFLSLRDIYTHNDESIEENLLNINYQNIVEKFIDNNFQFDILKTIENPIDYESIYEKNKLEIDFDKIEGNREYLSLLYFDKLDEIKKYIEIKRQEKPIPVPPTKPTKPIVNNPKLNKPFQPKGGGKGRGGVVHNPKRDKAKRNKGRDAEEDVYNNLIREYGNENVDWVSKKDDSLGYDIKYKNSNDIWKYVEVKTYSNNKFYLSKNEKRFAENHKEDYEIFLVGDKEIYVLTEIDFYDRDKFILEADSYVVYYGRREID